MNFKILSVYDSKECKFEFQGELFHVDKSKYMWIRKQLQLFDAITFRYIKLHP